MENFDPTNIQDIKRSLGEDLAKKSLGQHFLTNESVVKKMVESADLEPADTVFEIGPGLGILTREILNSPARRIIACELDQKLATFLREKIDSNRLKIISQNALTLIPALVVEPPFKVISNLPYNISSPALISLLTVSPVLPDKIVVMIQREVAERLVAPAGDSNRGLLTVLVELLGQAKISQKLTRGIFYPPPKVESAVLVISEIKPLKLPAKFALKILKLSFSSKRKKIKNSLFSSLKIPVNQALEIAKAAGFELDQRPEDLNRQQWLALIEILFKQTAS